MADETPETTIEVSAEPVPAENIIDYAQVQKLLGLLITIIGDIKLSEAKSWADVKVNAEALKEEGHEEA